MRTRFANTAQHADAFFVIRAISSLQGLKLTGVQNTLDAVTDNAFFELSCWYNNHHSEQLWMLEKVSAALNITPTTIPHSPLQVMVTGMETMLFF